MKDGSESGDKRWSQSSGEAYHIELYSPLQGYCVLGTKASGIIDIQNF